MMMTMMMMMTQISYKHTYTCRRCDRQLQSRRVNEVLLKSITSPTEQFYQRFGDDLYTAFNCRVVTFGTVMAPIYSVAVLNVTKNASEIAYQSFLFYDASYQRASS